jgi:PAS fold
MVLSESLSGAKSKVHGHLSRIMQALQRSTAVSYILDSEFRIMYCNPAWNRFARSNGAPQLTSEAVVGSDLFDVIPEDLRGVYSDSFQKVLSTGEVWESSYQCSSPTVFRIFRMRIHLLKPQEWFVVTNSLVVEQSHARTATADPNTYVDANGLVTACAHCRCSRRVDNPDQWDFVPEYLRLESAVKVSHGLCPICRAYFYH